MSLEFRSSGGLESSGELKLERSRKLSMQARKVRADLKNATSLGPSSSYCMCMHVKNRLATEKTHYSAVVTLFLLLSIVILHRIFYIEGEKISSRNVIKLNTLALIKDRILSYYIFNFSLILNRQILFYLYHLYKQFTIYNIYNNVFYR